MLETWASVSLSQMVLVNEYPKRRIYTALLYTARYDSTLRRSLADSQLILMLPLLRLLLPRPIGCGLQS